MQVKTRAPSRPSPTASYSTACPETARASRGRMAGEKESSCLHRSLLTGCLADRFLGLLFGGAVVGEVLEHSENSFAA